MDIILVIIINRFLDGYADAGGSIDCKWRARLFATSWLGFSNNGAGADRSRDGVGRMVPLGCTQFA